MSEDLGSLLGQLLGGRPEDSGGRLLASLLGTLGSGGGESLSGLLSKLREGGLGEQARSWIGTGPNKGVTGPQVAQALPYQVLEAVARQSGLSPRAGRGLAGPGAPRGRGQAHPGWTRAGGFTRRPHQAIHLSAQRDRISTRLVDLIDRSEMET